MGKLGFKCDRCGEKMRSSRQLGKHQEKCHRGEEEEDVVIIDTMDQTPAQSLGRPSVSRLLNISNENLPEIKTANKVKLSNETENEAEMDEDKKEEVTDDDILVVKSSIYKYHGEISLEDKLGSDVFVFNSYDDYDDDVVILEDSEDDTEEMDEVESTEEAEEVVVTTVSCEECGERVERAALEEHMVEGHPPRKREVRRFHNGCFFMLAT